LVIVWRNMATALIALQQPEEALEVAFRAVEQVRELGEQSRTAMVLEGYGEALAANGRADDAIIAYQEAAELYSKTGVIRGQVFTLQQWAQLPCARIESKLELLNRALELARKAGIKVEQAILHKEIADAYRAAGQWQSAVEHLERHIEMNRQVFTEKTDLKARTLRISHEFERARKDAEIERLRNVELAAALDEAEKMGRIAAEESRQKTEILHIVAHDLRNYTSALIGTAEVAMELVGEAQVSGELVEMLESFGLSAAHLDAMLEQMLDLSAVESGKININLSEFRLWELVEERMRTWSGRAAVKQQRMELAGESAHQVRADRMLTAEILDNLVTNALKYSPAASVVKIQLGATADQVSCAVLDQGPGVSAADQEKLYRPFQKLSARPTGGESAIGLGLYISRNLAHLQDGDLRYRDRPCGGGCFELLLPKS
jgi:signal transduction histidine kinase